MNCGRYKFRHVDQQHRKLPSEGDRGTAYAATRLALGVSTVPMRIQVLALQILNCEIKIKVIRTAPSGDLAQGGEAGPQQDPVVLSHEDEQRLLHGNLVF